MNRLKIAFVLDDSLDTTDGVQQYVLTLGQWLSGCGHEVHYLVGQTKRTDIAHIHSLSRNVHVRFNGNRMSMPLPASKRRLKQLLERGQFDIIHVQMPYSPWLAHRIIGLCGRRTAVIGTFHIAPHSAVVRQAGRILGLWTHASLGRFDRLLSVSQAAADFASSAFGISTEVLPNVIDLTKFSTAKALPALRDCVTILFLGRLVPRKGCQLLLEAAVLLQKRDNLPEFKLVVCGRGPLEAELRRFVASHKLQRQITFTGFISEADKPRYLKSADLAVFPSSGGESFGIVLIEAMAAGWPVVLGADNAGYSSVLQAYPDLLFPVLDAVSLANKLAVFMSDANARQAALHWQTSYVRQFDVGIVGPRLLEYYNQALHSRKNVR